MDLYYRILWFEDTDESFDTLSRRTERYVNSQALKCTIDRVWGIADFNLAACDVNKYDLLVVDLRLAGESKGYEIINAIRSSNYVNDILFYSSDGINVLESIMKDNRMEGVFITERNNRVFIPKIQQLIDKTIRRSENVVNIRGVVMDETSEFDAQMQEIIIAAYDLMKQDEREKLKAYANRLMKEKVNYVERLASKFALDRDWEISDIVSEDEFNSMMTAKVLNRILNSSTNEKISTAVKVCRESLPQAYVSDSKIQFVHAYDDEILKFRNILAHVKTLNVEVPTYLGEINGTKYYCTAEFCSEMRLKLIKYHDWFDLVYEKIIWA